MDLGGPMHEVALAILQKSEDERLDDEILTIMKWLREISNKDAKQGKVTVLGEIQDEVLNEIVKGCKLEAYQPNQILIKQGNVGYKMYIILTGSCDIRIGSADADEESEEAESNTKIHEGDIIRKKMGDVESLLGVSVGTFQAGHAFGEVALISGILRTASVIVNPQSELCQVLVIDKSLFDRTLHEYMHREEALRVDFIQQLHYFNKWPPKFKLQLQRGLTKARFSYDEVVIRQGDDIEAVYFIIEGDIKMQMIPELHKTQYARYLGDDYTAVFGVEKKALNDRMTSIRKSRSWCCLGKNEIVGELELLTGMKTYLSTAVATSETTMLRLNLREWERIIVQKLPQTVQMMKEDTLCRLAQRTQLEDASEAPMLAYAFSILYEDVRKKDKQHRRRSAKRSAADIQLPKIGLLVDIRGRGTVFDYINRRFKLHQQRMASRQENRSQEAVLKHRKSQAAVNDSDMSMEAREYFERCKLLKMLVEGVTQSRFSIGAPFLARVELEKIGMRHLEMLVTKFCTDFKRPGERKVVIPQLSCPKLPEPPKEPRIGILRPVKAVTPRLTPRSRTSTKHEMLPDLSFERRLATRSSYSYM